MIVVVLFPRLVTTPLTAIVFVRLPVAAFAEMATGRVIVQLPFAGIVPPARVISVPGVGEVSEDPQVPPGTAAAGTVKPAPIVVN